MDSTHSSTHPQDGKTLQRFCSEAYFSRKNCFCKSVDCCRLKFCKPLPYEVMKPMLKLFPWLIALALFSSFEANAQLTTIDYAERYADKAVNTSDYRASWNDQTTPITTRSLSDFYDSRLTNGSGHGSTGYFLLSPCLCHPALCQ